MTDVSVGVLGLGSIGLRHAKNLLSLGYKVIGFDPSSDRQVLLVNEGGEVDSKENILKKVSAVIIATPNQYHLEDLKTCVEAGIHAFVEKPLSHTMDGLDRINACVQDKKLIVGMAMNIRFNPAICRMKKDLDEGNLGRSIWGEYTLHSFLPDWRPQQDHRKGYAADPLTGGIIFDAVHGFDLARHFLGRYEVAGAQAGQTGSIDIPSDDIADILCRHENGSMSRLHMDYITKPKEHSYTLATDQGFASVDISRRRYQFIDRDGIVREDVTFTDTSVNDDYKEELNQFMKAVKGEGGHYCSLREGMDVLGCAITSRKIAGLPYA